MPRVLNKHKDVIPSDAVYIGRPSEWGNPFVVGVHGERGECVKMFEEYISKNQLLQQRVKEQLRGKDLVCFCAPRACHGDILLRIANDS